MHRIYTYLAIAGTILLALFGIHRSGKQSGKQQAEAKTNEQILQNAKEAKAVKDTVAGMSDDAVRKRLREKYRIDE